MNAGNFHIFIVEDDKWYGELLSYHIGLNPDYIVTWFRDAQSCIDALYKQPNLITIDLSLPDMEGEELYQRIKAYNTHIPVIVVSGQEDISSAVKLFKQGLSDYILKDEGAKELLWNSIARIRETQDLRAEVDLLKVELGNKYSFEKGIIGQSDALKAVFNKIEKAVKTQINVLVTGETGTGKELVAKAIHYNSPRIKKPFVAVNMAAIPESLMESELFGFEKGAFTGAIAAQSGKFEEANGGTIFLDEIGELSLPMQSKLLRVLQEREVVRIGGKKKVSLDLRLITATHKDLAEAVNAGQFREDLYYRIIGLPIALPPLRERGNDILILAKHFLDEFARQNKLGTISISAGAQKKLRSYHFPGNIRELKAVIELAAVMCNNNIIEEHDISYNSIRNEPHFVMENKTLREYNCDIIRYYLQKNNNDVLLTAKQLDIGKSTIYNMLQRKELT